LNSKRIFAFLDCRNHLFFGLIRFTQKAMQTIDTIFSNAFVLTMDEKMTQYERGAVAVNGDSIVAVGFEDEIKKEFSAKETIDCEGKVLMPGMINAHTHIPMTLLRGIADDLRLDVWLQGYIFPVEREFVSPEFVRLGTRIGCAELIRSGVTTFNDMYFFEDAIAEATAEVGLRAVCGESILKFPTPDSSSYEDAMEQARKFIAKWKGHQLI
jgi:5-methylthioadenosine/S-adenosylhomocysteine deaminase